MGFSHGKNARLYLDAFDLTAYFNDFQMNGKAGVADTTVYGKGAKTFIGGLKEGTIAAKAFFDSTASTGPDAVLAAALGRNSNMVVTFCPDGGVDIGDRCIVSYAAETDLSISSPVAGVNALSFTAQADSGLSSGMILENPTSAAYTTVAVTTGDEATTVAAGSNGVASSSFTGAGTLNVASTTGFLTAGTLIVATSTTPAFISYTGVTGGNQFTGCQTIIAGGNFATGGNAIFGAQDVLAATTQGLVACLHVFTLTGTTSPSITAKVQHSSDGVTWTDLTSFNSGNTITAPGAFAAFVAYGTTINKYLRGVFVTAGATLSTTFGMSAARQ